MGRGEGKQGYELHFEKTPQAAEWSMAQRRPRLEADGQYEAASLS